MPDLGGEAAEVDVCVQSFQPHQEVAEITHPMFGGDISAVVADSVLEAAVTVVLVLHGGDLAHVKRNYSASRSKLTGARSVIEADLAAHPLTVPTGKNRSTAAGECDPQQKLRPFARRKRRPGYEAEAED